MKKNMKKWLTCGLAVLLAGSLTVPSFAGALSDFAQAVAGAQALEMDPNYVPPAIIESGDYSYQMNEDGTITIAGYEGAEEDLVIPAEIDGLEVTAIGVQAFTYQDFASVKIPDSVRTIGYRSFEYCGIKDSLILPAGVVIQKAAFSYAELPETVIIPENAVVEEDSFSYCKKLETLIIETGAVIKEEAFSYSKALHDILCASRAVLEEDSFENCSELVQAILCGNVIIGEDPFDESNKVEVIDMDAAMFEAFRTIFSGSVKTEETEKAYKVEKMTFTVPLKMEESYMPGYQLFLTDEPGMNIVGAAMFPSTPMDFTDDATIRTMTETAKGFVDVEDAYKVQVCGYPAVWIDILSREDSSIGVYLYIAVDNELYHMLFLTASDNRDLFTQVVESMQIGGTAQGTDLSGIAR